jgi:hypothetical protein
LLCHERRCAIAVARCRERVGRSLLNLARANVTGELHSDKRSNMGQ